MSWCYFNSQHDGYSRRDFLKVVDARLTADDKPKQFQMTANQTNIKFKKNLNNNPYKNGVAYHKIHGVYHCKKKLQYDNKKKVVLCYQFLFQGIYCFGGIDNNYNYYQGMNVLFFQKIQEIIYPTSWASLKTFGKQPQPRINHTIEIINDNILVILGGINSKMNISNNIYLLNLTNLNWTIAQILDLGWPNLYRHNSCVIKDSIYVFGGLQLQNHHYNAKLYELQIKKVYKKEEIETTKKLVEKFLQKRKNAIRNLIRKRSIANQKSRMIMLPLLRLDNEYEFLKLHHD